MARCRRGEAVSDSVNLKKIDEKQQYREIIAFSFNNVLNYL